MEKRNAFSAKSATRDRKSSTDQAQASLSHEREQVCSFHSTAVPDRDSVGNPLATYGELFTALVHPLRHAAKTSSHVANYCKSSFGGKVGSHGG